MLSTEGVQLIDLCRCHKSEGYDIVYCFLPRLCCVVLDVHIRDLILHLKFELLTVNKIMLAGCNLWTRKENTAADNGVFYAITSESECMAECLTSSSCVAFDLSLIGCMLHNNADDLTSTFYEPGVTQFVLNRHCLLTSPRSTETPQTTATTGRNITGVSARHIYCFIEIRFVVLNIFVFLLCKFACLAFASFISSSLP